MFYNDKWYIDHNELIYQDWKFSHTEIISQKKEDIYPTYSVESVSVYL